MARHDRNKIPIPMQKNSKNWIMYFHTALLIGLYILHFMGK